MTTPSEELKPKTLVERLEEAEVHLLDDDYRTEDDLMQEAAKAIKSLTDWAEESYKIIKIFHGENGWAQYDLGSPEMKRLKELLTKYAPRRD